MSSVSFIVPVYNKSKYLEPVLMSLKNQKGTFKREFIFIDDGSTDDSLKILKKITANWKNCIIKTQKNKGSANATNYGIKLATMKYIKFLDADDVLVNSATDSLLYIIEKNINISAVYGLQRKTNDISNVKLNNKIDKKNFEIIRKPITLAMRNSMFNPSQCLVKTEECREVGGCDERVKFSQEYSLTLRLSLVGNFARLNEYVTVLPYIAPGQISENKIYQIFRVSKALELFLKDNNLEKKIMIKAQRRLTGRAWRFARRTKSASLFSKWFVLYVKGLLGIEKNIIKNCELANSVYFEGKN